MKKYLLYLIPLLVLVLFLSCRQPGLVMHSRLVVCQQNALKGPTGFHAMADYISAQTPKTLVPSGTPDLFESTPKDPTTFIRPLA